MISAGDTAHHKIQVLYQHPIVRLSDNQSGIFSKKEILKDKGREQLGCDVDDDIKHSSGQRATEFVRSHNLVFDSTHG